MEINVTAAVFPGITRTWTTQKDDLGGGFKYFLFSPQTLQKWSNLTSIFFKWVGSTTN